jgi:hypothetical protein
MCLKIWENTKIIVITNVYTYDPESYAGGSISSW